MIVGRGADSVTKINSIQYLRAAAVLLVIAFHCSIRIKNSFPAPVIDFLRTGGAGVDLFFVISGFIMWTISADRPVRPQDFFARRMTRVIPIYWLMTTFWVGLAAIGIISWVRLEPIHLLKSYLFIPSYSLENPEHIYPVLIPGWTLFYEMFFYALFAVCLAFPQKIQLGLLSLLLGGLVLIGLLVQPTGAVLVTYTHPLLLEFLAGVLIGHLWRTKKLPTGVAANLALVAGLIGLGLSTYVGLDEDKGRVLMWGIPAVLVVIGALGTRALEKSYRLPLAIGNASYSIYLSHTILLTFLAEAWRRVPGMSHSVIGGVGFTVIAGAIVCVAGWLSYRWLEQPLEAFFRKMFRLRASPPPQVSSGAQ